VPTTYRSRIQFEEQGFSLTELLTVVLIIGILAAIALPVYLSLSAKGQDADAKSNARNMVSQLESCYARAQSYANCDTSEDVFSSGISLGDADSEVELSALGAGGYELVGHSLSGNTFTIERADETGLTRRCTPHGSGGCPDDGNW